MAIILASQSPRRYELLQHITSDFCVKVSNADETSVKNMSPEDTVRALAELKGKAVFKENSEDTVISADTVVELNGKILGKPHTEHEAFEMLSSLSDRTHIVHTGVCILSKDVAVTFSEKTSVTFMKLSSEEILQYIESGEPFDKAGGYGIQGKGCLFVERIDGDYYNVMGLPVARLYKTLKGNKLI